MGDLISRQAAIDKLRRNIAYMQAFGVDRSITLINDVPTVDPVPVRCKDCKHWREGGVYSYCDKLFNMGVLDAYDYMTEESDFCSRAERRTDERVD